ncbi:hypothetical protein [Polaribacter sargassicola]|uniref:hypothetical protein n=1 Tax=Polaribacter sargassicola TaxID=2836891 RepID=UPI001F4095A6|nr:hypothetical protein [Polaribacter sp. DS7-9]MCG1037302.1 hypothetical protein [Polaribacter sp. DS7-9]
MKKIILDSFKSTLKSLHLLNLLILKEKSTKEDLKQGVTEARDLLFSSFSSLNIFAESITNHITLKHKISTSKNKKKVEKSKIEVKVIYNDLVNLVKNDISEDLINLRQTITLKNQSLLLGLYFMSSMKSEEIVELNKHLSIDNLSKKELLEVLKKYFNAIINYIEEILFYDVFLIFDKPEITYTQELLLITDYKKEYINKWVDCTVTLSELRRNKKIDYWSEILDLNLDSNQIQKIEKHQEILFYENIDSEVLVAFSDIEELNIKQQIEQIEKELILINGFFNGDLSKLTVDRLKKMINFSKPKKLILAYDQLKKSNSYNAFEYCIYDFNYVRKYTDYFVAAFFIKYLIKIEESLKVISVNNPIQKIKTNSKVNDIVKKIEDLTKFEFLLNIDDNKVEINKLSDEINYKYSVYTDELKTDIKAKFLEGNFDFLKRLLALVEESINQWLSIKSEDNLYFKMSFINEKYKNITDEVSVNHLTELKLIYLKEIKKSLLFFINNDLVKNIKEGDIIDFESFITDINKRDYVYRILEYFGAINSNRKSTLTQRKKGVLRGVVEALIDKNVLPEFGLHNLCLIIAKDIGLELKSKLDYHDTAKKIHNEAKKYIVDNPFH